LFLSFFQVFKTILLRFIALIMNYILILNSKSEYYMFNLYCLSTFNEINHIIYSTETQHFQVVKTDNYFIQTVYVNIQKVGCKRVPRKCNHRSQTLPNKK